MNNENEKKETAEINPMKMTGQAKAGARSNNIDFVCAEKNALYSHDFDKATVASIEEIARGYRRQAIEKEAQASKLERLSELLNDNPAIKEILSLLNLIHY